MIKNMCLTAGLVLGSTTAANACSYHFPPNFNFQYETLEQGTMNTRWAWQGGKSEQPLTNLISNLDILMIARPAEDQIVTDKPKEWWVNDNDDREYRRIRWDVLRYIKGNSLTPLYVRDPKGKIYPTLAQDTETTSSESKAGLSQSSARKEFIEAIETRIVDRKSFAFWDAPVLKDIMMVDVTQFTSCGEVPVPAFDFNRFYIVGIDKNGATAFAEPLSNENASREKNQPERDLKNKKTEKIPTEKEETKKKKKGINNTETTHTCLSLRLFCIFLTTFFCLKR